MEKAIYIPSEMNTSTRKHTNTGMQYMWETETCKVSSIVKLADLCRGCWGRAFRLSLFRGSLARPWIRRNGGRALNRALVIQPISFLLPKIRTDLSKTKTASQTNKRKVSALRTEIKTDVGFRRSLNADTVGRRSRGRDFPASDPRHPRSPGGFRENQLFIIVRVASKTEQSGCLLSGKSRGRTVEGLVTIKAQSSGGVILCEQQLRETSPRRDC